MKRFPIIIFLNLLQLAVGPSLFAKAADIPYSGIIHDVASLPMESLIAKGKQAEMTDQDKALVIYMVACNRDTLNLSDKERELSSYAHFRVGYILQERGNYAKALDYLVKGLKICDSTEKKRYAAQIYKDIGIIYNVFKDYERGLEYMKKSAECLRDNPDSETEFKLLTNTFFNYISLGDLGNAESTLSKLKRTEHPDSALYSFYDRYTVALLESQQGKHRKTVDEFIRLAKFAADNNLGPQYECTAYENAYKDYWALNMPDSSFHYINVCKDLSFSNGLRHKFTITLRDLADYYEYVGNPTLATKYKAEYFTELDSIFNTREFDIVKNNQFAYEMEKIDNEISDLNRRQSEKESTISRLKTIVVWAAFIILVVSALLIWVYTEKRKVKRSYHDLFEMYRRLEESQLKSSQRERELIGEINAAKVKNEEKNATPEKYNNSNLSDEMRNRLTLDINNVMENTLDYCSDDFTLDKLAEMLGSNTRYVSQIINGTYGKNFNSFVNEYRVRLACARLADENYSSLTINAIGQSVGFKSNTTFTSVFKKITGLTPSLYLKMAREAK